MVQGLFYCWYNRIKKKSRCTVFFSASPLFQVFFVASKAVAGASRTIRTRRMHRQNFVHHCNCHLYVKYFKRTNQFLHNLNTTVIPEIVWSGLCFYQKYKQSYYSRSKKIVALIKLYYYIYLHLSLSLSLSLSIYISNIYLISI